MPITERQQQIRQILLAEQKVEVRDLARRLGTSELAIRKDLADLELGGICLRTAGGAVLAESPEQVVPYIHKQRQLLAAKEAIAAAAAARVRDGDFVLLDAGSTTMELARLLRKRDLSILTNSLPAADVLAESETVKLTLVGGTFRRASMAFVGPVAQACLKKLRVTKAFLGAAGFDREKGFCSANLIEAQTKAAMLEIADQAYILTDATKFAQPAFTPFAPVNRVHAVITNQPLLPDLARLFSQAKVEVIVAGGQEGSLGG